MMVSADDAVNLAFSFYRVPLDFAGQQSWRGKLAFRCPRAHLRVPARGRHYSANLSNYQEWDPNIRAFADYMMGREPYEERPFALRYSGAMVADLHRVQLEGGIYFYPADKGHPNGKLRLLYECAPMAFILESAGGRASTGRRRILDITPEAIHQTAPLAIGGKELVQLYERFAVTGGP